MKLDSKLGDPGTFLTRKIRDIGMGGLGVVEEVEVTESYQSIHSVGTRLAKKYLRPEWQQVPDYGVRFDREILALHRMSHENIIPLSGVNLSNASYRYYFMPLCKGSCSQLFNAAPNGFRWDQVARFGISASNAIQYAHGIGYLHRDIKPDNLLIGPQNQLYVADWGFGYFIHKDSIIIKLTNGGLGTQYYCPMEQWTSSKNCDPSSDVYSLGMTLAELTIGKRFQPFVPGTGVGKNNVLSSYTNGSRQFEEVLRNMTQPFKSQRYQTMTDVSTALRSALSLDGLV